MSALDLPAAVAAAVRAGREGESATGRHVTPHRRKALRDPSPAMTNRDQLDAVRLERERLAQVRGELASGADAERAAFARGQADRDALIGWASRVSRPLAAELGADPAATFAAPDRLAREHLDERAHGELLDDDL